MKKRKVQKKFKWVVESPNPLGYKLYIAVYQIWDEPAEVRLFTAKSFEEAKKGFGPNWWILEINSPEDLIRYGGFLDLSSIGTNSQIIYPFEWRSTSW